MIRYLIAAAVSLALATCSAVVPSTAARLASFDPVTADPATITLVVIMPQGLAIRPGSARLDLATRRGGEQLTGSYRLEDRPLTHGVALSEGATVWQFAVERADVTGMRALQAKIADWKRTGDAHGSLGVGLGACAVGDGPAPDATGSVLIRVQEDGPLLPLIREGRLSDLLGSDVLAAIKPCQGAE